MRKGLRDRIMERAGRYIDRIARISFLGKGLVAIVVGGVALRLATGEPAALIGPEGALERFVGRPLGRVTLGFMAASLGAHAVWKLVQAVLDPEQKGRGIAAIAERIAFGVTALGYAALGAAAAQLALGGTLGPPGDPGQLAAGVLTPHFGRWLVGLAGTVIVVMGLLQIRLAVVAGFSHVLRLERMNRLERMVVVSLGRAGYTALGIISGLIGWFLIRVAVTFDPSLAGGWRDALGFLGRLGETRWPLGIVAGGLVCYGLYFVLQAGYRVSPTAA